MKRIRRTAACLMLLLAAAACVTVNIYFPAAKVEKAADEIVKDVYGKERTPQGDEQSFMGGVLTALWGASEAHAQAQGAGSESNAAIRGLKAELADNHKKLAPYYEQGAVGITADGLLAVRDTSGLSMRQVAELRRLVESDNAVRERLYAEVARALDIESGQVAKVREVFADKWRDEAPGGYWIQKDGGSWVRK